MMNALFGSLSFLFVYLYLVIPLAPIVYIFLKWRSYRDGAKPDPQLGMKVVLFYFKTLAYQVLVASLAAIFSGLFKNEGELINIGLGLFIGSLVIYGIHHLAILKMTNAREFPLTGRIFTAFNLVIIGLVGMISFMITMVTLASKGFKGIEIPLACFVVYAIAWGFQLFLFCKPRWFKKSTPCCS